MNRLTVRLYDNVVSLKNVDEINLDNNITKAIQKLAAYEDIGLEPHHIDSIVGQLLGYLDAEEAGLLIELPCKVGDTVYVDAMTFGTRDDIEYAEAEVVSIRITKKQAFVKLRIFALGLDGMPYGCENYPVASFGKTVFAIREGAEKALEASNGE